MIIKQEKERKRGTASGQDILRLHILACQFKADVKNHSVYMLRNDGNKGKSLFKDDFRGEDPVMSRLSQDER